jgi:hypothetical protein
MSFFASGYPSTLEQSLSHQIMMLDLRLVGDVGLSSS